MLKNNEAYKKINNCRYDVTKDEILSCLVCLHFVFDRDRKYIKIMNEQDLSEFNMCLNKLDKRIFDIVEKIGCYSKFLCAITTH